MSQTVAITSTICLSILFVVGICLVIWALSLNQSRYNDDSLGGTIQKIKDRQQNEGFDFTDVGNSAHFYIYNYLLKPIRVEVLTSLDGGKNYNAPIVLVDKIDGQSRRAFKMDEMEKHLLPGNRLRIFIVDEKDRRRPKKHYSDYVFDTPDETTIKRLYVGMITSKWVGSDYADYQVPGANAVQGMPWIKMHNFTDQTVSLNNNIDISPGGVLRYSGRDHFGVRLGTVFEDQNGIYPTFIFSTPATDVYYGVTSDLQQALFGGFQLTENFVDSDDEPMFLLENGWMGGPAEGNIPTGYIPSFGPLIDPVDRWGRDIDPTYHTPMPVEFLDP